MQKHLLETLDRFPNRKIAVIGDLIADEFLYGQIARVSREAPVLVLEYRDLVRLPGGAANAANNLLDLGCRVTIAGVVGQDESGKDLIAVLKKKGADVRTVRKIRSYATPVKTRILAGAHHSAPQQVVRVDRVRNRWVPGRDLMEFAGAKRSICGWNYRKRLRVWKYRSPSDGKTAPRRIKPKHPHRCGLEVPNVGVLRCDFDYAQHHGARGFHGSFDRRR